MLKKLDRGELFGCIVMSVIFGCVAAGYVALKGSSWMYVPAVSAGTFILAYFNA